MNVDPNQGQNPNQPYGGYTGYTPTSPEDDPYGGFAQRGYGQQQSTGSQQGQQQQYGTYQPPRSAYRGRSFGATGTTATSMEDRKAAVWSYALWWVSGIVFFFLRRRNPFVRFHAAQSTVFFGGVFIIISALYLLLGLISPIPILGFVLGPVLSCLAGLLFIPAALVWVFLMVQAYRGVTIKLPIVGDYAEALVARFTKGTV